MRTSFRKRFARDLRKIKDQALLVRIQQVILAAEEADTLQQIGDIKKIAGTKNCYRIRIGEYRIGVVVEGDAVEFVRCLPRRDLYRYFP